jgi:hypothetical protein
VSRLIEIGRTGAAADSVVFRGADETRFTTSRDQSRDQPHEPVHAGAEGNGATEHADDPTTSFQAPPR